MASSCKWIDVVDLSHMRSQAYEWLFKSPAGKHLEVPKPDLCVAFDFSSVGSRVQEGNGQNTHSFSADGRPKISQSRRFSKCSKIV